MCKKIVLLILFLFQAMHGMEVPLFIPKDVMSSIVEHVVWPIGRKSLMSTTVLWIPNILFPYIKCKYYLQLVSKDFRCMFWDCFTLDEKRTIIQKLLYKKEPINNLVDIAVSMKAGVDHILSSSIINYQISYMPGVDNLSHSKNIRHVKYIQDVINLNDSEVINSIYGNKTPLQQAITDHKFEIVRLLLESSVIQVNKNCPLFSVCSLQLDIGIIKLFLMHPGIDVNTLNKDNETAIFALADVLWGGPDNDPFSLKGLRDLIDLFIEKGIDSSIQNKDGKIVLDVVRERHCSDVIKIFEQTLAIQNNV